MMPRKFRLFSFLYLLFALLSCEKSNDQVMKETIEDHFKNKNESELYADYEPINFGRVDTLYTNLESEEDYAKSTKLINRVNLKINEIIFKRNTKDITETEADRKLKALVKKLDELNRLKDKVRLKFKKSVIGYSMQHVFNIKNNVTGKIMRPTVQVIFYDNLLIKNIVIIKEG